MADKNFYTSKMTTSVDNAKASKPKIMKPKTAKTGSTPTGKPSTSVKKGSKNEGGSEEKKANVKKTVPTEQSGSAYKKLVDELGLSVSVKSEGPQKSGLFDDESESEKIVITVKTDKSTIRCYMWMNEGDGMPDEQTALKFVRDELMKCEDIKDLTEFKEKCGFSEVSEERASSAFDYMKKYYAALTKMFPDENMDILKSL